MIAADTSSLVAYFAGDDGRDVEQLEKALESGELRLPPIVFTEVLSDPKTTAELEKAISEWRHLPLNDGYWLRAARMRAHLLSLKLKPKLPDTLIAQSAIDHNVSLITRDGDFRHFAKHCGLKLA